MGKEKLLLQRIALDDQISFYTDINQVWSPSMK